MKDYERDTMRKIILSLVKKGPIHWTDLKKKILGSCYPFATDSTFAAEMRYLLRSGHIERVERGTYSITDKGKKYLEIL